MKKNLQTFSAFCFFTVLSLVSFGQIRSIPIGVTVVSPASGTTVPAGGTFTLSLTLANLSTTETLLQGDTILFNISPMMEPEEITGAAAPASILPGGTLTIQFPQPYPNPNTTTTPIEEVICVTVLGTAQSSLFGSWENPNYETPGCTTITLQGQNPSAVEGISQESMSIYPNPANGLLNIQLNDNAVNHVVTVHNSQGQLVCEVAGGMLRTIATTDWAEGIYLISVTGEGRTTTQRVIVQH